MPPPSKTWVDIADSQVDPDSPLDTVLMTGVRDDLVHLREWLGYGFTPAQAHVHNGTDSAFVVSVADEAITPAKLSFPHVFVFDDFLLGAQDAAPVGWRNLNSSAFIYAPPPRTGGWMRGYNTTAGVPAGVVSGSGTALAVKLSSNTLIFETRIGRGLNGNPINQCHVGFSSDTGTTADGNDCAMFVINTSNNNWEAKTRNAGGSLQTTDTGVATSMTPQKLRIVVTTSNVKFYIDDVLKATHSTQIPSGGMYVHCNAWRTTGNEGELIADYILMTQSTRS